MIIQRQTSLLKLFPVQVFRRYSFFNHSNAISNRAYQLAKITAYTFFFFYCISIVRIATCNTNGLMRSIFAGNVTKATVNAFILVDVGNMMVINIEVFPMNKRRNRFPDKIINNSKSFFIHPVAKAFTEILNYSETMSHGRGANLHITCPEKHKLCRILPGTNTTYTRNGNFISDVILRNSCQKF